MNTVNSPVKNRYIILDALRGFALLGICLANFPEFSLYTFQPQSVVETMPSAATDKILHWLMLFLVDGKFYTIFSILFGIGFSIILNNAKSKGINGNRLFYRRMAGLAAIGLIHLMLLWSGDILLLYALMGMLLPLFINLSDKKLLVWSVLFLFSPVVWDFTMAIVDFDPSKFAYDAWWRSAAANGITERNFGTWLRDADTYPKVWAFLVQGAHERLWEFVDSSRYFKVLGLFLFGVWIGRKRVFVKLDVYEQWLKKIALWCMCVGLPLSVLYAMCGIGEFEVIKPVKSLVYFISVYPLGIGYCAIAAFAYIHTHTSKIWKFLSFPGRMALSNYVGQSIFGIIIFYGIGFGYGASLGLGSTAMIALTVFVAEVCISAVWLRIFNYGPLEWLWRMWNYRKYLPILKQN